MIPSDTRDWYVEQKLLHFLLFARSVSTSIGIVELEALKHPPNKYFI